VLWLCCLFIFKCDLFLQGSAKTSSCLRAAFQQFQAQIVTTPFCFRGRGYGSAAGDVGVPGFKGRQCDLQQKMRRLAERRGCGEMIEHNGGEVWIYPKRGR
jgi:hypothetical protein